MGEKMLGGFWFVDGWMDGLGVGDVVIWQEIEVILVP